jgi:hypothetical protein
MVGYSTKWRGGHLAVVYVGPDGARPERMTRCRAADANYHTEAARVIARAYVPTYPDPKRTTWDDTLGEVERTAADLRPATMVAYRKVARVFLETLDPAPKSPAEVTPEVATTFAPLFLAGTYARGKASATRQYKRLPITLASHVRNLSALWRHLGDLALVTGNPRRNVRKPQMEKKRKSVPAQVVHRFAWVRDRYPIWDRIHALLELKALSDCRSLDIVQLRSDQLRGGRVTWTADQTKQKEGRAVPADLFVTLKRMAGPVYLWGGRRRPATVPAGQEPDDRGVRPDDRVLGGREHLPRVRRAHPDRPRLTPHSLRRRCITLTTMAVQSVDVAAHAIGVNPATSRAYHLDAQRAFDADENEAPAPLIRRLARCGISSSDWSSIADQIFV